MQARRTSSLAADYSWESAAVLPSKSSMVGAILATATNKGEDDAGDGPGHAEEFLELLRGKGLLS